MEWKEKDRLNFTESELKELGDLMGRSRPYIKEFMDEFDKATGMKKVDFRYVLRQIKDDIAMALLDQGEPLLKKIVDKYPKEGYAAAVRQRSAAAGVGYGISMYEQAMDEVFGGEPKHMVRAIQAGILATRLMDIFKYKKFYITEKGYSNINANEVKKAMQILTMMQPAALKVLLQKIPDIANIFGNVTEDEWPRVFDKINTFFRWNRKIIDDLEAAGMLKKEDAARLRSHDFRKIKTLEVSKIYDMEYNTSLHGESIKAYNSGIESLGIGKTKIIDPDARSSSYEQFVRAYGSIANQVAKQAWADIAVKYPDNGFVVTASDYNVPSDATKFIVDGEIVYAKKELIDAAFPNKKELTREDRDQIRKYYSKHKDSDKFVKPGPTHPEGWSPMPIFVEGDKKYIYFHPDAAKYLVTRSHDISKRLATAIKWFSMSPVTRSLAVGTSPLWSTFIGLPMDVIHSLYTAKYWDSSAKRITFKPEFPYFTTKEGKYRSVYSPFKPGGAFRLGKDVARIFSDVYFRGGRDPQNSLYMNLMKHGMSMPFLAMRHNKYMKGMRPPGSWEILMDIFSYHGVGTELMVRAGVADRVIRKLAKKRGMTYEEALKDDSIMYEAVHAARDRLDYNQGGWLVKALDNLGIIFLNAGVLASRTYWRSAKTNPVDFTFRNIKTALIAAGITATAWLMYEDKMKDIPAEGNEVNAIWPIFPD